MRDGHPALLTSSNPAAGHARAVEQQLSALEAELRKLRQQQEQPAA